MGGAAASSRIGPPWVPGIDGGSRQVGERTQAAAQAVHHAIVEVVDE